MPVIRTAESITFPVDDVTPATTHLRERKIHESVRDLLKGDIESCSDYTGSVVHDASSHALLDAVHLAFSQHRPLVLTPDAVWITIAQGVAHHMALHAERLRDRFVAHDGKLTLTVTVTDFHRGSPENDWPIAFEGWADQIRQHVGDDVYHALACDFTTSGLVERAVGHITMMDVFERYFHYELACICGIPAVTLTGTPDDWRRLRAKAATLDRFDLGWWLEHLLPICDQFIRAAEGDVDLDHWRNICKLRDEYGGDIINGWIAMLFPYLREWYDGPATRRNPIFETGKGFQSLYAPPGLSRVPFTWRHAATLEERPMEAIGGLVGVSQDWETFALTPKLGWAVRQAPLMDRLIHGLTADSAHLSRPGVRLDPTEKRSAARLRDDLPEDLEAFYHATDGAQLFRRPDGSCAIELLPREALRSAHKPRRLFIQQPGEGWEIFAQSTDALAIHKNRLVRHSRGGPFESAYPIALCDDQGRITSRSPILALDFTEFLNRLLTGGPTPFWLDPAFKPCQNAGGVEAAWKKYEIHLASRQ